MRPDARTVIACVAGLNRKRSALLWLWNEHRR